MISKPISIECQKEEQKSLHCFCKMQKSQSRTDYKLNETKCFSFVKRIGFPDCLRRASHKFELRISPASIIPLLVPLLNILFAIAGSGAACIACGSKWYFDLAGSKYHFDPHL